MQDKTIFIIAPYYGYCHVVTPRIGAIANKLSKQYKTVLHPLDILWDNDMKRSAKMELAIELFNVSDVVYVANEFVAIVEQLQYLVETNKLNMVTSPIAHSSDDPLINMLLTSAIEKNKEIVHEK